MRLTISEDTVHADIRDQIRSVGVNLFVALEEVLDYSLAISGWALLADHYRGRRFTFRLDQARTFVAQVLNKAEANGQHIEFDQTGKNTLYALVNGFGLLAREVHLLLQQPDQFTRIDGLPGHSTSPVDPFPLMHTCALFDLDLPDVLAAVETLHWLTRELTVHGIIEIRNRLDHQRQDFPTVEELTAACDNLERLAEQIERGGLFSPACLEAGSDNDEYRRGTITYRDYAGRSHVLPVPPVYSVLPTRPGPMILLSALRFKDSSEIMRFTLEETSAFTALWDNYPRRRLRLDDETHASQNLVETATSASPTQSSAVPLVCEPGVLSEATGAQDA